MNAAFERGADMRVEHNHPAGSGLVLIGYLRADGQAAMDWRPLPGQGLNPVRAVR